jgi:HK97 family phage major capsid protein
MRDSGMNAEQQRQYDNAERRFDALTDQIELAEAAADTARWAPEVDKRLGVSRRSHSGPFLGERRFAQALGIQEDEEARDFSVGRFLQGLAGVRSLAEDSPEYRVLTGGGGSAGTLVPNAVASAILDGVFPASVVHQAGAEVVPMPARQLTLPRIDTPPTPGGTVRASRTSRTASRASARPP